MSYADKLKDPRWQKKRLEIFETHGWRCEDCGTKTRTLHVHHCFYIRALEPWEHGSDLLMCLCDVCHEFRQGREEAMHVALGQVLRGIPMAELEARAWDMIHDAIKAQDLRKAAE